MPGYDAFGVIHALMLRHFASGAAEIQKNLTAEFSGSVQSSGGATMEDGVELPAAGIREMPVG